MNDVADTNQAVLDREKKPKGPKSASKPVGVKKGRRGKFIRSLKDLDNVDEVISTVLSRLRQAVDNRLVQEADWQQIVLAWLLKPSTEVEDGWESKRYLPIIFKHVETAVPILYQSLVAPEGPFRFRAESPLGKRDSEQQTSLCNFQATGTAQATHAYERDFWWKCLLGTSYIEHFWDLRRERRIVPKFIRDPATGRMIRRMLEEDVTVANTPRAKCLNPLDVWPDPDAEPGDDVDWYCIAVRTKLGALADLAETGTHIDADALEKWIADTNPGMRPVDTGEEDAFTVQGAATWQQFLQAADVASARTEPREDDYSDGEQSVVVLKYVSKYEIVTMGDRTHLLGYSRNSYSHGKTGIVMSQLLEVPGSAFGRGLGHVLMAHQELANQNINVWMDTAMLELMAPVIADKSKVSVLEEDFIWEPNKLIRARGIDAIKRLEMPAPTNLAMQVDAHLARDADDATGFAAQARGVAGPASQTATLTNKIQSNLTARLAIHLARGARTIGLSGDLIKALNQQFLDGEQMVSLQGEEAVDYVVVKPEEIMGKSRCYATIAVGRADPTQVAQQMASAIQVVVPLIVQGLHKDPTIQPLLRAFFKNLDVPNADLIFPKSGIVQRDPVLENAYVTIGGQVHVSPAEDHTMHAMTHLNGPNGAKELAARLEAGDPTVTPGMVKILEDHAQEHFDVAMQMGMQMGAGGAPGQPQLGPGGAPPSAAGTRAKSPGTAAAGAAGANGAPGVASPGPRGAPGRPL